MNTSVKIKNATPFNHDSIQDDEPDVEGRPRHSQPFTPTGGGECEPNEVHLVDAPDGDARDRALELRVRRLAEANHCSAGMLRCVGRRAEQQLSIAGKVLTQLSQSGLRTVLGIDGTGRWLQRPAFIAALLCALPPQGVFVVCGVDTRDADSRMFRFCLRALGCTVICETAGPGEMQATPATDVPSILDSLAFSSDILRQLTDAGIRCLEDRQLEHRTYDAFESTPSVLTDDSSDADGTEDESLPLAVAALMREQYAQAYCNEFAVHRLLREWKCL
ncbi:hypothetical protein [Paraburkholderia bannensis]|uniref:hypothetical protein n=1 Tax=Paraburkholderia bannensis TaxID=765414 RepID=UPI002AC32878|nr:hypothetical protein [Paraburkholderia bannensis]